MPSASLHPEALVTQRLHQRPWEATRTLAYWRRVNEFKLDKTTDLLNGFQLGVAESHLSRGSRSYPSFSGDPVSHALDSP